MKKIIKKILCRFLGIHNDELVFTDQFFNVYKCSECDRRKIG